MSSSHGAKVYRPLARYSTPYDLCAAVVAFLPIPRSAIILEPHVGEGPWLRALLDSGHPRQNIIVSDVDPTAPGMRLAAERGCRLYSGDFLTTTPPVAVDLTLGNPPYGIPQPEQDCPMCRATGRMLRKDEPCKRCKGAKRWTPRPKSVVLDHVQRARELVRPQRGGVAFLLRSAFSEARRKFWADPCHMPREKVDIDPRPGFDPEEPAKTDSASYSVFWWDMSRPVWDSRWNRLQWREYDEDADAV